MLHVIQTLNDPLLSVIKDDPVRPEISVDFRVSANSEIFVLLAPSEGPVPQPVSVVCAAYRSAVPSSVTELLVPAAVTASVAVFYTIWSYRAGAGRELIQAARSWIEQHRSHIREFVTLSPCSDMARRFHIRNGAQVLRVNSDTVNYVYP